MLCGMVVISVGLAFLRSLNGAYVAPGLFVATGALLLGTPVGMLLGRVTDAQFWAVLGATFAFISAVDIVAFHWAWAGTGAAAGAAVGVTAGGRLSRTLLAGGLAATAAFGTYAAVFFSSSPREILFDLAAAPVIGMAFGLLVEIFFRLEQRTSLPRYVTATVLMVAVCVGNYFAR